MSDSEIACARSADSRRREDGDEHAEPERPAELVRDVHEPGRGARVLGCDAGDAGCRQRRERARRTDAEDRHRDRHARDVGRVGADAAEPDHPDECREDSAREHACVAEARDEARHELCRTEDHERQRQECGTGLDGAEAEHALQVLRDEEEHAEHSADEEHARHVRAHTLATREQAQRRDRLRGAPLGQDEEPEECKARRERGDGDAIAPAGGSRAHDAVHDRRHPCRRRERAGEVEVTATPFGLRQDARSGEDESGSDRHVDEEAEAPREPAREDAAEDEADAGAAARHGRVVRDRAVPLAALREARHEQRERGRSGDRCADALDAACGEQPRGALSRTGRERGQREEGDAGDEHAAPAEEVAGARSEQEQPPERERVGVLHPGQAGGREAEGVVDAGEGVDDDRDVEHDHQVAAENDRELAEARRQTGLLPGDACAKVEGTSTTSGGNLRYYTEGPSACQIR